MGKLTRDIEEQAARINDLGGYQRVFNAIAASATLWPCKEAASGISVSVFAFVDALDGIETSGRAALEDGRVA